MNTISRAELARRQREQWEREQRAAEQTSSTVAAIAEREGIPAYEAEAIKNGLVRIGVTTDAKRRFVIDTLQALLAPAAQPEDLDAEAEAAADASDDDDDGTGVGTDTDIGESEGGEPAGADGDTTGAEGNGAEGNGAEGTEIPSTAETRPDNAEPGVQISGHTADGQTLPPATGDKALVDMTKDELEAYAKANFGKDLDKRLKKDDLVVQVRQMAVDAAAGAGSA